MKTWKTISLLIFAMVNLCNISYAQDDVTKFLGIPVDGYKPEMIKKLEEKGFAYDKTNDLLEGEFNGENVYITVSTNNNKVWRILIIDKTTRGETAIKIRFNELCRQFTNNDKYIPVSLNQTIPTDERLRYKILVQDKRYEAAFLQAPSSIDTLSVYEDIRERMQKKYSHEELLKQDDDKMIKEIISEATKYLIESSSNRSVWFMICNRMGEYYIAMYYDNKLNQSKGEDL